MFRWVYYRWARVRSWGARQRRRAEDWLPFNGRNGFFRNGNSPEPVTTPAEPEREAEPAPEQPPEPVAEGEEQ
jgi:hypothetical protein